MITMLNKSDGCRDIVVIIVDCFEVVVIALGHRRGGYACCVCGSCRTMAAVSVYSVVASPEGAEVVVVVILW